MDMEAIVGFADGHRRHRMVSWWYGVVNRLRTSCRLVGEIAKALGPNISSNELQVGRLVKQRNQGADTLKVFASTTVAGYSSRHPDFSALAGRMFVAFIHKNTEKVFSEWVAAYATGRSLSPSL